MLLERLRVLLPDACLVALRLAGWLAVTLLAVLGCFVVLFVLLGDVTADGFFAQLGNLARRFAEAEPGRRERFFELVTIVAGVVLAIVALGRWRSLEAVFHIPEKGPSHG